MKTDALLLTSFGGPEGPDDVLPFLENVTRGRHVPRERLEVVAGHYLEHFGGVSPLNEQNRQLQRALQDAVPELPVYWGNRNWHPFLSDTLATMHADGIRRALAVVTSAFPSYSGCRQYQEDLVGPVLVEKLRHYYAEEGFLAPLRRNVARASEGLSDPRLVFTAHSIPLSMAEASGPDGGAYEQTLRLASAAVAGERPWDLVWQSRSGPPHIPWLEPDVGVHVQGLYDGGAREVVVVPIGFTSDHVEVVYDLDVQLRAQLPDDLLLRRAATVGSDPEFVAMLARLVRERIAGVPAPPGIALHHVCPSGCCTPLTRSEQR
ncbi:MAG: protoporphyrin/coproporphyrin ferrochelatase [Frankiales bacterium]|jgi:ferrochelatase|nr:protoporphyrin/coproporphyrin ferrochelatase [Frankiales bacterium]